MQRHQAKLLFGRGSSHHFEIWQRTLQLVAQRPLFGHGLAANLDVPGLTFPHNLYLSLLFYSGAIGFALFAAMAGACTWRLWRMGRGQETLWAGVLWLNGLLAGLTDLGQITKGPDSLWFIVWLPAGLLMTAPRAVSADPQKPRPLGA
jgi:O-antigen ligase